MSIQAYKLPNGKVRIPKIAEDKGILGDGFIDVESNSKEAKEWIEYYKGMGEKIPEIQFKSKK